VLPSGGGRKLYSEVAKKRRKQIYKLSLTPKEESLTPEQIGIKAIKTIRHSGILIETDSQEDMFKLTTEINTRLGERLEITKHRLWNPRLIIYNVKQKSQYKI